MVDKDAVRIPVDAAAAQTGRFTVRCNVGGRLAYIDFKWFEKHQLFRVRLQDGSRTTRAEWFPLPDGLSRIVVANWNTVDRARADLIVSLYRLQEETVLTPDTIAAHWALDAISGVLVEVA